jgi:hypothetical protein
MRTANRPRQSNTQCGFFRGICFLSHWCGWKSLTDWAYFKPMQWTSLFTCSSSFRAVIQYTRESFCIFPCTLILREAYKRELSVWGEQLVLRSLNSERVYVIAACLEHACINTAQTLARYGRLMTGNKTGTNFADQHVHQCFLCTAH